MSKKRNNNGGWIGYDLDGSLAFYGGFKGHDVIGDIIPLSKSRILKWLEQGINVKIVTARADDENAEKNIQDWLEKNGLPRLEVTNKKDYKMWQLWDDRAVQLIPNTGLSFEGISLEREKNAQEYDMASDFLSHAKIPTHDDRGALSLVHRIKLYAESVKNGENFVEYKDRSIERLKKVVDKINQ